MKIIAATLLILAASPAFATQATPLTVNDVIATYSSNHNVKVLTPDISAPVHLHGLALADINYDKLLAILSPYEYSAVESGDLLIIKHKKTLRSSALPIYREGEQYANEQYVTATFYLDNLCAQKILPVLRPLIPQHAHLAADAMSNSLWVTATFANVMRLKQLTDDADQNTAKQKNCSPPKQKK